MFSLSPIKLALIATLSASLVSAHMELLYPPRKSHHWFSLSLRFDRSFAFLGVINSLGRITTIPPRRKDVTVHSRQGEMGASEEGKTRDLGGERTRTRKDSQTVE